MYGGMCGIAKYTFEIPHNISYPYAIFVQCWQFKSSQIYELVYVVETLWGKMICLF